MAVGRSGSLGAGRGQLLDQDFPVVQADVEPAVEAQPWRSVWALRRGPGATVLGRDG